jgi:hypothetical protein
MTVLVQLPILAEVHQKHRDLLRLTLETAQETQRTLLSEFHFVSHATALVLLRGLAELGWGVFKLGRRGHPTRLEWTRSPAEFLVELDASLSSTREMTGEDGEGAGAGSEEGETRPPVLRFFRSFRYRVSLNVQGTLQEIATSRVRVEPDHYGGDRSMVYLYRGWRLDEFEPFEDVVGVTELRLQIFEWGVDTPRVDRSYPVDRYWIGEFELDNASDAVLEGCLVLDCAAYTDVVDD